MGEIQVNATVQLNPVQDLISGLHAVVASIVKAVWLSLDQQVVRDTGGHENLTLRVMVRLYVEGSGDCGTSFEYAVHDAVRRCSPLIVDPIFDALAQCGLSGDHLDSLMLASEKANVIHLAEKDGHQVTDHTMVLLQDHSALLLHEHLQDVRKALGGKGAAAARKRLPESANGIWQTDLLLGQCDIDLWVGASVKRQLRDLERAPGVRVGIVPSVDGKPKSSYMDSSLGMYVCALPYDGSFSGIFFRAWHVVKSFLDAKGKLPPPERLSDPIDREIAKSLADMRALPVVEVIARLEKLGQPELVQLRHRVSEPVRTINGDGTQARLIVPIPLGLNDIG